MANCKNDEASSDAASRFLSKGAWTADEDRILAQYVEINGPKKWKSVAIQSGLKRCGKSCRLRWLNYLRPDIKRGNMSDAEDDLILRLQRLLGNRWSLIARRLPGRTDNEIKNYWNAHLRKKAKLMEKLPAMFSTVQNNNWSNEQGISSSGGAEIREREAIFSSGEGEDEFIADDVSTQETKRLEWVKNFLELEEDSS